MSFTTNARILGPNGDPISSSNRLPVSSDVKGNAVAEDSQTEADAASDVLTFAENVEAIDIFHSEDAPQDFVVNGLTIAVPPGGWRSSVGGTPSADVTLPTAVTGIAVTRLE